MSSRDAFAAIADPTRREILELLRDRGVQTAGEIAANFASVSRPGISRHLRVLRECGVVASVREGMAEERRPEAQTMAAYCHLLRHGTSLISPRL